MVCQPRRQSCAALPSQDQPQAEQQRQGERVHSSDAGPERAAPAADAG